MAVAAVRIAKQVDGPVKVVWTREEDIQHDIFRPVYRDTIAATLSDGKIVGWKYKVSGSSIMARWFPPGFQNGVDIDGVDSAIDMPYDIPNLHVEFVRAEPPAVPTGFWRGVGPNNNVFAIECFMDELARAAGVDPVELRLKHLSDERAIAVIKAARERSGLASRSRRDGSRGMGLGFARYSNEAAYAAVVVEVVAGATIKVVRAVAAVDCGRTINPDGVSNQVEGGIVQAVSWVLKEQVRFDRTRITTRTWDDYPILRFSESPPVEVSIIDRPDEPSLGVGEAVAGPVAAAIANAVFDAIGVRVRDLPLTRERMLAAINDA
jgi:isoquinoline 1-oxidoreductase beta subunit